MAVIRFKALEQVFDRKPNHVPPPSDKTSDYYAINVFDKFKMQKYLSKDSFNHVMDAIDKGTPIDRRKADSVAAGMKAWATERGTTHYTHWFQPLTGGTAEKHDAFIKPTQYGGVVEAFSGSALAQQEPDASSFPSGGIRNTFEARGYTAWDPTSPAFIIDNTLSIPTVFISYTGEALDHKTPLLKALNVVDKAATEVCQLFDKNVTKVHANLGWEQEYFLIDEALYYARPDLALTGRTLMGHASAKDQQLDDHYFGSIPERVTAFMHNLESECYKLGIPVTTRHNEVAPNQYELAPVFEECNLAVDHNVLLMDLMKKVSRHHGFRVLFHEKPFQGINGTGKHNNWSLATDTGVIVHKPGKNPKSNLQFLTYIVNTIKAVFDHQDLLRASIASASNAHRLGANEAPPAILSCFLGTEVSSMLDQLEEQVTNKKMTPDEKTALKLDIGKIPEILLDNTDRNRTSPFAFTGNRFEIRAVGSQQSINGPLTAMNTIMTESLDYIASRLEAASDLNSEIQAVLQEILEEHGSVIFNGDGYSTEWHEEAAKRGLPCLKTTADALPVLKSKEVVEVFEKYGVLSEVELQSREEIYAEQYCATVNVEANLVTEIAKTIIYPTAVRYLADLASAISEVKSLGIDASTLTVESVAGLVSSLETAISELEAAHGAAGDDLHAWAGKVIPAMLKVREVVDALEGVVADDLWPLPTYQEMLFIK
jgi:glutamine synthetase